MLECDQSTMAIRVSDEPSGEEPGLNPSRESNLCDSCGDIDVGRYLGRFSAFDADNTEPSDDHDASPKAGC